MLSGGEVIRETKSVGRRPLTGTMDLIMKRMKAAALAGALVVHAPCALASYHDGALGFMVLVVAAPIWIVSLLVGLALRSSSAFEREGPRFGFQSIALLIAVIPILLGASPNDPTSASMVVIAAAVYFGLAYAVSGVGIGEREQSPAESLPDEDAKPKDRI